MVVGDNNPAYPISIAAKILNVHPRTLRLYEEHGLISVQRVGGKRLFTKNDIRWIKCLRDLIHQDDIKIEILKVLLDFIPCWKFKNCDEKTRNDCRSGFDNTYNCWSSKTNIENCRKCQLFIRKHKNKNVEDNNACC